MWEMVNGAGLDTLNVCAGELMTPTFCWDCSDAVFYFGGEERTVNIPDILILKKGELGTAMLSRFVD
jgi:hypothetical protein